MSGLQCAHLRVSYRPVELAASTCRERWECDSCGTEFVRRRVAPVPDAHAAWEDCEFYRARWVTDDPTSKSANDRLVLMSPEGDGGLVIRDETLAGRRDRAEVVDADCTWLTPDEVRWLYEQLRELVEVTSVD